MLKENNKVLKCSNASPDWRGYVDFVNNVVVDGLSRVICASLGYLLDQVLMTTRSTLRLSTFTLTPRCCESLYFKSCFNLFSIVVW